MNETIREYSKALFLLGVESNNEKKYEESLDLLSNIFSENPQYLQFLSSPAIPLEERIKALEEAFSENLPAYVMSFVKLLCEKRYIKYYDLCVIEYKKLLSEINKCSNAKVISAVELTDNEKESLKEKLEKMTGRAVLMEYVIDESILGGLIVEIDGKVVNSSIKGHLKSVKDVIGK